MKINVTKRDGTQEVVEGKAGETMMTPLHAADLVEATCSGSCSCATCHVFVAAESWDKLPEAESAEVDMLEFLTQTQSDSRLACQIVLRDEMGDLNVTIAPEEGY